MNADILNYTTLASLTYDTFKTVNKTSTNKIPAAETEEDDLFIREAIIGGRCQDFKVEFRVNDRLYCVDVKSLYPFIMLNSSFPIGRYKKTKAYRNDKHGIYSVKITKQPNIKIIPKRRDEGEDVLNWDYEGKMRCVLTSVDIECLKRHGGDIEFIPQDNKDYIGIYWNDHTDNLFNNYLAPIKDEKTRQDQLAKADDPKYNPALRNICKLLLNSLSG